jgi:hypothetical protein
MRILQLAFGLALISSAAFAQQDEPQGPIFWMPDANTCAKILPLEAVQNNYRLNAEEVRNAVQYAMVIGWLQGYVSATNAHHPQSNGDLVKGMNVRDLMSWVFSFCRYDPDADYFAIVDGINKAMKLTP